MSDYFVFGTVDTRNFGVEVYRQNRDTVIPMAYTAQSPAGVSGDILIPENRYPNRRITYDVLATASAATAMERLQNALLTQIGYQRLTDSFDTDVYMMAALTDSYAVDFTHDRVQGKAKVTFNRMPQRYLLSPASQTLANGAGTVTRPTDCYTQSSPLIKIFAEAPSGTSPIRIDIQCYNVATASSYDYMRQIIIDKGVYGAGMPDLTTTGINIDTETMEVYGGSPAVNLKPYVILANKNLTTTEISRGAIDLYFPTLTAKNVFSLHSGSPATVSSVVVYPRWWKL